MQPIKLRLLEDEFKLHQCFMDEPMEVVAVAPRFTTGVPMRFAGYALYYKTKEATVPPQKPELAIKPISPTQAQRDFNVSLDPLMIQAVNNLLTKKGHSPSITIKQKDIHAEYKRLHSANGTKPLDAFKTHQFDFEDVFREAGWHITYDKPGYNESYDATFEFKIKSR